MKWLRDRGLIASYDDYLGLPLTILEDAHLLMEAEAVAAAREGRGR